MNKSVDIKNRRIIASSHVKLGQKNKMGQTFTDPNELFLEAEGKAEFMTGSEVIREAIKRASVDISVAYPITFAARANLPLWGNALARRLAVAGCSPRRLGRALSGRWKIFRCGRGRGCLFRFA